MPFTWKMISKSSQKKEVFVKGGLSILDGMQAISAISCPRNDGGNGGALARRLRFRFSLGARFEVSFDIRIFDFGLWWLWKFSNFHQAPIPLNNPKHPYRHQDEFCRNPVAAKHICSCSPQYHPLYCKRPSNCEAWHACAKNIFKKKTNRISQLDQGWIKRHNWHDCFQRKHHVCSVSDPVTDNTNQPNPLKTIQPDFIIRLMGCRWISNDLPNKMYSFIYFP